MLPGSHYWLRDLSSYRKVYFIAASWVGPPPPRPKKGSLLHSQASEVFTVQKQICTLGLLVIKSSLVNSNYSFPGYFERNVNLFHGLHVAKVVSINWFQSKLGLLDLAAPGAITLAVSDNRGAWLLALWSVDYNKLLWILKLNCFLSEESLCISHEKTFWIHLSVERVLHVCPLMTSLPNNCNGKAIYRRKPRVYCLYSWYYNQVIFLFVY